MEGVYAPRVLDTSTVKVGDPDTDNRAAQLRSEASVTVCIVGRNVRIAPRGSFVDKQEGLPRMLPLAKEVGSLPVSNLPLLLQSFKVLIFKCNIE
jgi:hypothetical protein